MSTLLALSFADLHLHPFQAFAINKYDRLNISFEVWRYITLKAKELKVPVLFAGDLLHDPDNLKNKVFNLLMSHFQDTHEKEKVPLIAISGNHDMSEKNTGTNISPSYLAPLSKVFHYFFLIDRTYTAIGNNTRVYGVPFMNDDKAWVKMVKQFNKEAGQFDGNTILLLHTDLPNCPTPTGFVVKEVKGIPTEMDTLWGNFTHVLSGHIHKPHRASDIAQMLGSPCHQNEGDAGCEMGYWEIYDDKKVFKPLNQFPRFIREEDYNDDPDYLSALIEMGNYLIPTYEEEGEGKESIGKFSSRLPVRKLVTRYLKNTKELTQERKHLLLDLLTKAKND